MTLWHQPLTGAPHVTSPFGPRTPPRRPNGARGTSNHLGTDYRAPTGTPVLAIADGRVVVEGISPGRGLYVQIDHGDGILSLYQHLSTKEAKRGTRVKGGERIGRAGTSGNVAAHLHLEVKVGGVNVDPVKFLDQRRNAPKPPPPKAPSAPVRVLREGMSGADVRELQRALNRIMPAAKGRPALVVDGSFGWRTAARLRDAQRRLGLVSDALCGPLTRKALRM